MRPDAVILFAHGSLLCGSAEALYNHARRLKEQNVAPQVVVGFLNFSEPRFQDVVAQLAQQGIRRVLVAPYFLVPGKFVRFDLPNAITEVKNRFPQLEIWVAEPIGYDASLADALVASALAAVGPEKWRADLEEAARFCRSSPQCPLYGTAFCPNTAVKEGTHG